jgi:hypothetical protein
MSVLTLCKCMIYLPHRRMATAHAEAAELAAECARADNHELGHEVCVLHCHSIY